MAQAKNTDMNSTLERIAEISGLSKEEVSSLYEQAKKGASVAEMFHIPAKSLEAGYALACNLFSAGKIHDAETMYRALCQYDNDVPRNWIGLGCCLEKKAEYREAVFCFARAAQLGYPMSAKPLYLLAQCCYSIQDKEAARKVLDIAISAGNDSDPEQARYRKLSQELMATLG
ncbi:MAG: hypothetical protein K5657_02150 [Desulfovibrio sp.]|nr:hypothetical protein [Desulfovibrio sp.]